MIVTGSCKAESICAAWEKVNYEENNLTNTAKHIFELFRICITFDKSFKLQRHGNSLCTLFFNIESLKRRLSLGKTHYEASLWSPYNLYYIVTFFKELKARMKSLKLSPYTPWRTRSFLPDIIHDQERLTSAGGFSRMAGIGRMNEIMRRAIQNTACLQCQKWGCGQLNWTAILCLTSEAALNECWTYTMVPLVFCLENKASISKRKRF